MTFKKKLNYNNHKTIRIFHWLHPSGWTLTLSSTQSLNEMSARNISLGEGGGGGGAKAAGE